MGSTASVHQLIHLSVDVVHARVGDKRWYAADFFVGFWENRYQMVERFSGAAVHRYKGQDCWIVRGVPITQSRELRSLQ